MLETEKTTQKRNTGECLTFVERPSPGLEEDNGDANEQSRKQGEEDDFAAPGCAAVVVTVVVVVGFVGRVPARWQVAAIVVLTDAKREKKPVQLASGPCLRKLDKP